MQEKYLFEYAVIRVVPRVEREEFINIGVVLYCARQKFLKVLFELNKERLHALSADIDADVIEQNMNAFERICAGGTTGGAIGKLDIASRFRWLTATRSTVLQTSKPHPGHCTEANETLNKIYNEMVL